MTSASYSHSPILGKMLQETNFTSYDYVHASFSATPELDRFGHLNPQPNIAEMDLAAVYCTLEFISVGKLLPSFPTATSSYLKQISTEAS